MRGMFFITPHFGIFATLVLRLTLFVVRASTPAIRGINRYQTPMIGAVAVSWTAISVSITGHIAGYVWHRSRRTRQSDIE